MTKIEQVRQFARSAGGPFTVIDVLDAIPDLSRSVASTILSQLKKAGFIRRTGRRAQANPFATAASPNKDGGYFEFELVDDMPASDKEIASAALKRAFAADPKPAALSLEDIGAAVMGHVERLERRIATLEGQAKDATTQARLREAEHRRALDEKEQEKRKLADTIVELNGRIAALQVVRRPAVAVGRFFESA